MTLSPVAETSAQPEGTSLAQPLAPRDARTSVRAGEVDLRPKFEKGVSHGFVMKLESAGTQRMPGADDATQTVTQEIGLTLRCVEHDPEKGSTLELVYDSLKLRVSAPTGDITFDSAKPANDDDVVESMLRGVVGLTQRLALDRDGNITSVTGVPGAAGGGASLLGQFTGADMIKNVFGPVVGIKKGKARASVGESWTTADTMDGPGAQIRISTTHTLASMSGSDANITITGAVVMAPASPGSPIPALTDSSIGGAAIWDTQQGMLRRLDTTQRLTIEQKTADGPMVTTQHVKMSITRRAGAR